MEETKSTTLESLFRKNASPYFVLDSNDRDRMEDARCELERFLIEDELRNCVFILLVNKQDLDNAMSLDEVRKTLKFDEIKQTNKNIFGTVATTGQGLTEAIDWLLSIVKQKINQLLKPINETVVDAKQMTASYNKKINYNYV